MLRPCAEDEPYPSAKHTWKSPRWQAAKAAEPAAGGGPKVFVAERDNFATAAIAFIAFSAAFSRNAAAFPMSPRFASERDSPKAPRLIADRQRLLSRL